MTVLKKGLMFTLGAALLSMPAFAGTTLPQEVVVDLENMRANGDMTTARTTRGKAAYIGCGTRNSEGADGSLFSWAFCQARNAEEEQVVCTTFNPELVATVRAVSDFSFVTFRWTEDENGALTCNHMGFSTQSFYLGKQVKKNRTRNIEDDDGE